MAILQGQFKPGETIEVDLAGDALTFTTSSSGLTGSSSGGPAGGGKKTRATQRPARA